MPARKVVLAPNAFKGCLTGGEAAAAMAAGVARVFPDCEIVQAPVADGGDGLVDVAADALGGEIRTVTVTGPLGEPREAAFCYVPAMKFAAVEMALASGLALLGPEPAQPRPHHDPGHRPPDRRGAGPGRRADRRRHRRQRHQ